MSSDKKPEPNYKAIEELLLFGKYPDDMFGKPEKSKSSQASQKILYT